MNNDHFYKVGKLPGEGETVASLGMETFPGGKGLNQSIAMARAGAPVYHGGTLGGDGELPRSALLSEGVDISFIRTEGQLATGHAIVAVDADGRNSIIVHGGANYAQTPEHVDSVFSGFAEGDFEIIPVDDCSTDSSPSIIKELISSFAIFLSVMFVS